ncbi:MAG: DUF3341 domain-containing protein [Bdellovibrionales bacterium]|nr:DUF3341 domain-containing protein [Bdellovibrionales bacterium]
MKGNKVVVGVYTYLDDILSAIEAVKEKSMDYCVYAPTYIPDIEEATDKKRSHVCKVSLTGALTGLTAGFTLAIWCGLDWPLRVSAKEVLAVPAYVVIGYECTILLGAISTLLAIFHFCRLPDIFRRPGYDPRFSYDKFGLVVGCDGNETDAMKDLLQNSGADEVSVKDGI